MIEDKKRRKNDIILIGVIILVILGFFLLRFSFASKEPELVKIKVDGKIIGSYSLDKNNTIKINNDSNEITIKDKKVTMSKADCPDQICVKHKAIDSNQESIICLPNKVVVEISSAKTSELDSITN